MRYLLIMTIILTVISCTDNNIQTKPAEKAKYFAVHFQTFFDHNNAELFLNDSLVFNDTLTTNYILSVANTSKYNIYKGFNNIKTNIDGEIADTMFELTKDTCVIGIVYRPQNKKIEFTFYYPPHLPIYD